MKQLFYNRYINCSRASDCSNCFSSSLLYIYIYIYIYIYMCVCVCVCVRARTHARTCAFTTQMAMERSMPEISLWEHIQSEVIWLRSGVNDVATKYRKQKFFWVGKG